MSAALEDLSIVDAHHHFWELGRFPYRWLAPDAPPRPFGDHTLIKRNYLPPQYRSDFAEFQLEGSVHVQANCGADDPVAETKWLQSLFEATGLPNAIVAEANLSDSHAPDLIARHAEHALLRGVRAMVAWDADGRWRFAARPHVLLSEAFGRGASALVDHNLSLDLVVVPGQLSEVLALASAHPDLRIVIDHLGQVEPDQPGNEQAWRQGLDGLKECDNVFLKASGLWTIDRAWRIDRLRPFLAYALETFGAERMMFGSNLPVEHVSTDLSHQIRTLHAIVKDHGGYEVTRFFSGTAKAVYRL